MSWKSFFLVLMIALGLGGMYRVTELAKRPMHTDEAILALKTQEFWKTDFFKYDPKDYHGPFLHHATRALGWIKGWHAETLDEEQVRFLVVVFGMGVVLLPLLLVDVLGRTGAAVACLLTAVSPMMTYYSRYYIMEVPFIFLLGLFIACLWRWSRSRNILWMLIAGVCLGCMHATKETFVLNIAAMGLSWFLVYLSGGAAPTKNRWGKRNYWQEFTGGGIFIWILMLLVAGLTSVWLFSNGFRDWVGVQDSVMTYQSYLHRSGGSGHEKPWDYYFEVLFWTKNSFLWTEALIGVLAVVGVLHALFSGRYQPAQRTFLRWLGFYAIALLALYCLIPYKTPWSVLAVNHTLILLAGAGMACIFQAFQFWLAKAAVGGVFAAGVLHLCDQTSLVTDYKFPGQTRYAADPRNPYVYSHTSPNLVALSRRIHELASAHPDGLNMSVQVVQSEYGWPLGWYLRDMPNVGYFNTLPAKMSAAVAVVDAALEAPALQLLTPLPPPPPPPSVPAPVIVPQPLVKSQQGTPVLEVMPEGAWTPVLSVEPEALASSGSATVTEPLSVSVPPPPPLPVTYSATFYGLRPGIMLSLLVRSDLQEALYHQQIEQAEAKTK